MIVKYVTIGTREKIEVTLVGATGVLINNEQPHLHVRRMSDNKYYNFTNGDWISFVEQSGLTFDEDYYRILTQPDLTIDPGKYSYELYLDPDDFPEPDSYALRVTNNAAANTPLEGEIKTQYASFDEAIAAMERTDIVKADADIVERKVQRGMPEKIWKQLSSDFWIETVLTYDFPGGQIIRATSSITRRTEPSS